jgi:hypothetical protein
MDAGLVSSTWRRHLRFRVRGLILIVLLVGGWLGWIVRSARIQREAVEAILQASGHVDYDWEPKDGKAVLRGSPWAQKWLIDRVEIEYFGRIRGITLLDATRSSVAPVTHFPGLERLTLGGKSFCDADLTPRQELTQLSALRAHVAPAPVCDVGGLSRLTNLRYLALVRSGITDEGLVHLERMTKLRFLLIPENQAVTDAGVAHLSEPTKLRYVDLSGNNLTDAALAQLSRLPDLSYLDLRDTKVTDAGLVQLKGLIHLSTLLIRGTKVTASGARALERALPQLTVER